MRRAQAATLALILSALVLTPVAEACWECSDSDRCETPANGEEGYEECLAYQVCTISCDDVCTTGGDTCEAGGLPGGPEGWGLSIPNGEPLASPPIRRIPVVEPSRA